MKSTAEAAAVEREIVIAASPETVWQFLVDPDRATRWMGRLVIAAAGGDPGPDPWLTGQM